MPNNTGNIEKPRAEQIRPELTRLPELTWGRIAYRKFWATFSRFFVAVTMCAEISGLQHFPEKGPALIVTNHLGGMDAVLALAAIPAQPEGIAAAELYDWRIIGRLLHWYGAIWIHRGTPDRRAIRCATDALADGRFLALAPEGRESVTGELEVATGGAAFIALRAEVPVVPIAMTGTEDDHVFGSWKRLKRPAVSLKIGAPISLADLTPGREANAIATQRIMQAISDLLPPSYRGYYRN